MIPLTRPITILVHEPIMPLIKSAADDEQHGNISEFIRLMLYGELVRRKLLSIELLKEIG